MQIVPLILALCLAVFGVRAEGLLWREDGALKISRRPLGRGRDGQTLPDLADASIEQLRTGLDAGTFTSLDLVGAYIRRIEETNPHFHAVLEVEPDALSLAQEADAKRKTGAAYGPLLGIPILVKDNLNTARTSPASMNTSVGSYALLGSVPKGDSTVVARLKSAGALILGKAGLSEFANFRCANYTSGWSARAGHSYGVYHEQQDPCGSSSGSAIAASLGLAAATIGTETDGSITCPTSFNALAGIKPTVGLTSRYGCVPISETQDSIGPMSTTLEDAAMLLDAIAGRDDQDRYTSAIPFDTPRHYPSACRDSDLKGVRLGVPRSYVLSTADEVQQHAFYEVAIPLLESLGAIVVLEAEFPHLQAKNASWADEDTDESLVIGTDFRVNLASYLADLSVNPHNIRTLEDLQQFVRTDPREMWPSFDTGAWDRILKLNLTQTSPAYLAALQRNKELGSTGAVDGAIERHQLDALVMPTASVSFPTAINGHPSVTLPMSFYPADHPITRERRGLVKKGPLMPFGISFTGRHFSEDKLIGYACALERVLQVRDQLDPIALPWTQLQDVIGASPEDHGVRGRDEL